MISTDRSSVVVKEKMVLSDVWLKKVAIARVLYPRFDVLESKAERSCDVTPPNGSSTSF